MTPMCTNFAMLTDFLKNSFFLQNWQLPSRFPMYTNFPMLADLKKFSIFFQHFQLYPMTPMCTNFPMFIFLQIFYPPPKWLQCVPVSQSLPIWKKFLMCRNFPMLAGLKKFSIFFPIFQLPPTSPPHNSNVYPFPNACQFKKNSFFFANFPTPPWLQCVPISQCLPI